MLRDLTEDNRAETVEAHQRNTPKSKSTNQRCLAIETGPFDEPDTAQQWEFGGTFVVRAVCDWPEGKVPDAFLTFQTAFFGEKF